MLRFKNLKMAHKLTVQVSIFVLSLIAITVLSQRTITEVKVGGEVYQGINKNFDLVSDVYSPNFNLLNSWLVFFRMLEAPAKELPKIYEEAKNVRSQFDDA